MPRTVRPAMTFRIYGESGARCLTSGWYACRKHPEVERYFGESNKFTACPGPDNGQDEAHNTTWVLTESDAGGDEGLPALRGADQAGDDGLPLLRERR